jgi:hypothetical protein
LTSFFLLPCRIPFFSAFVFPPLFAFIPYSLRRSVKFLAD